MARLVSVTETPHAAGASYPVLLGAHDAGDLLLVCVSNDQPGAGTTIVADVATAAAGWTLIGTQASSQATRQVWFKVVATSGAMANPVFTVQNTGTTGTCLVYKEHNGIGGVMRSDWGNSTNINSAASNTVAYSSAGGTTVITPAADSLMLYSWNCDNGAFMRTKLNDLICDSHRATTGIIVDAVSHVIGHVQLNSASCPNVTMYASIATEGGNGWVIEIKNAASGTLQKQIRADITETGGASNWYGAFGVQHAAVTWNKPSTFVAAGGGVQTVTINGTAITLSDTALGTVTPAIIQDSPWGSCSYIPNSDNANVLAGGWHTISSSNLDGKIFSFQWNNAVGSSSGRINTEGTIVGFASSDGNYAMYQVCTKAIGWLAVQVKTAIIDLNNATLIASAGSIDWTAVVRVGYFWHRASGSASTDSLGIQNACLLNSAAITGGSATDPANFQVAADDLSSWGHKLICEQQASSQVVGKFPIQIGDGTNYTYFDSSASSLEFERGFSATQKDWNVNANKVSVTILAKSGDTVIMAAGVAASETAQALNISASSSLSATYSFVGESIVGLTPTDNAGLSWTSATFKSGGTVTMKAGADLASCNISKTTSTNAALSVTDNNTVLASSTIDITGTSAAYHVALGAAVTAITMNGVTLTGTPGTDKIYSALASGTLTITVDGTGTSLSASDVTFVGGSSATASVVAPQPTLDATVLSGSRVVLYNDTTAAELDNTAPAGTLWSKVITSGASSGDTLTLHVFKEGYEEFSTSFIYAGIDNTLLVSQSVHASVASLRTELGITDYTTITEFALDITGTVEIDADDADGSTTKARLAIWYNGVLTTENGARYLRGAITILSTAAFRINTSILDLKIENVSVTYGLNFTDIERRLYRDDGAAIYAPASAPGSIQNDYSGVPDTVTTSDQSLNLATAEQAIDNKLSSISSGVWTYVVTGSTTAVQMMRGFAAMLLGKVSGAGTGAETFRDIADTKDVATFMVDSSGNRTAVTRDLT